MMQRLKHVAIPLVILAYGIDAHAVGGLAAHHNFPSTAGATSMEVSITVEAEPPSTSGYFWAQQFWVDASVDHGGYLGLQTGGVIGNDNVGKMIIFSVWNATSAVAGPGAVAQTFGGEGIGYSVRLAYPWQEGVPYRFRLEKESALGWRVSVTSPDLGTRYLGTIQVTQNGPLRNVFAAFTEYFRNVPGCSSLAETRASFSPVTYGATVSLSNNPHAYGTCETWARAYRKGNSVVHDVAMLFANGFD